MRTEEILYAFGIAEGHLYNVALGDKGFQSESSVHAMQLLKLQAHRGKLASRLVFSWRTNQMLAGKYNDIIIEALRTYEATRQEKDALAVIGRAARAGLIEPGHYDEATVILREQIEKLPENENFLQDDHWDVLTRKALTDGIIEATETDIDFKPAKSGAVIPEVGRTAP